VLRQIVLVERLPYQSLDDRLAAYVQVMSGVIQWLESGDMAGTGSMTFAPVSEWWPFRKQFIITLAASPCSGVGFRACCNWPCLDRWWLRRLSAALGVVAGDG